MANQTLTQGRLPQRSLGPVQEMGQLFDRFFNGNSGRSYAAHAWFAPASLWEDENHFYLEIEMPGVKQEDVEIVIERDTLRIAAERHQPEGERKYWHQERGFGRVERTVSLPESVNGESIEAELQDGVLFVKLAKRPESQPRRVQVKGAAA
jgi:HSP20 family protein